MLDYKLTTLYPPLSKQQVCSAIFLTSLSSLAHTHSFEPCRALSKHTDCYCAAPSCLFPLLFWLSRALHSLASTISKVCTGLLPWHGGTRGIQNPAAKMNLNAIDPAVGMWALLHWSARESLFPLPPNTHTPPYNLQMYVCMAQVRGLSAACPLTPGDTFATAVASAPAAAAVKFAEYLHNNSKFTQMQFYRASLN